MTLRLVSQRYKDDCALACVAMVTGKRYEDVFRAAVFQLDYSPNGPFLTRIENLRHLLRVFGFRSSRLRPFRGFDRLGELAILLVNYDPPTTKGHWIVFERHATGPRVLNPSLRVKHPIHQQLTRLKVAHVVELRQGGVR